jgi:hypothetical protein
MLVLMLMLVLALAWTPEPLPVSVKQRGQARMAVFVNPIGLVRRVVLILLVKPLAAAV